MIFFVFIGLAFPFSGSEYKYRENTGDGILIHTYSEKKSGSGYIITWSKELNSNLMEYHEIKANNRFETTAWHYTNPSEETSVSAYLKNGKIILTGKHEGKKIFKEHNTRSKPWYQIFPFDLRQFVNSSEEKMEIIAIGSSGIGAIETATFKSEKVKYEVIDINEEKIRSVFVKVSLSVFWTGKYWYRKSDGLYIMGKAMNGPFKSETTTYLFKEKN
jgi:hypothetical protein